MFKFFRPTTLNKQLQSTMTKMAMTKKMTRREKSNMKQLSSPKSRTTLTSMLNMWTRDPNLSALWINWGENFNKILPWLDTSCLIMQDLFKLKWKGNYLAKQLVKKKLVMTTNPNTVIGKFSRLSITLLQTLVYMH